ncbi:Arginyl-tRNA--protein transferase 1 [Varicellaria rhodocarpa]|nr:Arginyl-tRNA--protein transferase 1 [Varicellaria rhodocarpa]
MAQVMTILNDGPRIQDVDDVKIWKTILQARRPLDAAAFQPAKDQRKAINRFGKYVLGSDYAYKAARLCPKTKTEKKRRRNKFDLSEAIRNIDFKQIQKPLDPSTKVPIEPAHKLEITLEPDEFTEEKYALFAHYQKTVHKNPPSKISKKGFKSFLCSGLGQLSIQNHGGSLKVGSYHQCYRLDGRLVAMGVLDLLPQAVSSVYLIYDKSVDCWNFGKISAMQEINFALEKGYKHYYMDPESYSYSLLDTSLLNRLTHRPYISVSRDCRLGLTSSLQLDSACASDSKQELETEHEKSASDLDYLNGQHGERSSVVSEAGSLFEKDMPGVMGPEEDLSNWETSDVTDAFSIKGIAAELAAVVGPDIVRESIIEWPV